MAVMKIKTIKNNFQTVINYAKNGDKTDNGILVSSLNCSVQTAYEEMSSSAERNIKIAVQDFMTEAEDILMKHLPEVDSDDVVRSVSSKIDLEIQNSDLFSYGGGDAQNKNGIYGALANGAIMVLGGAVGIGIKEGLKAGYHAITHEKKREELLGHLMELRNMESEDIR